MLAVLLLLWLLLPMPVVHGWCRREVIGGRLRRGRVPMGLKGWRLQVRLVVALLLLLLLLLLLWLLLI